MVFLPEGYDYLAENKQQSISMAESIDGPRMIDMCQLAKENNVWLSLGGFHNKKVLCLVSVTCHAMLPLWTQNCVWKKIVCGEGALRDA